MCILHVRCKITIIKCSGNKVFLCYSDLAVTPACYVLGEISHILKYMLEAKVGVYIVCVLQSTFACGAGGGGRKKTFNGQTSKVLSALFQYCGSMKFWCGSGSRSGSTDTCLWMLIRIKMRIWILLFSSWTFKMQTKNFHFLGSFSAYYFFIWTSFFKHKKSPKSHKTVEIKVFLTNFA